MEQPKMDLPDERNVNALLSSLHARGVRLWSDGEQLRYEAPTGILIAEDVARLRALKGPLLQYLQQRPVNFSTAPPRARRPTGAPVPLSFSQRWHWNAVNPTNRSFRVCYATTRLSGELDISALEECVCELLRRHEALRTRIIARPDGYAQEIRETRGYELVIESLVGVPQAHAEQRAQHLIAQLLCEPIELSASPLFCARLLKIGATTHVLVIAMDHIISDGASLALVSRDLWTLYAARVQAKSACLAEIAMQFPDYALWQHSAQPWWEQRHARYWEQRLGGAGRLRLFPMSAPEQGPMRLASYPLRFGNQLTERLRLLSRQQRTTLAMCVLTVYAVLLSRWCNKTDLVIPFMTDGRHADELDNTVGLFACPIYLRVEISRVDTFISMLQRVTVDYRGANDHFDSGRIAAQSPLPEFARNPLLNWIPRQFDGNDLREGSDPRDAKAGIERRPFCVPLAPERMDWNTDWDCEPSLVLGDSDAGISGSIWYAGGRILPADIERLGKRLLLYAESLTDQPSRSLGAGA